MFRFSLSLALALTISSGPAFAKLSALESKPSASQSAKALYSEILPELRRQAQANGTTDSLVKLNELVRSLTRDNAGRAPTVEEVARKLNPNSDAKGELAGDLVDICMTALFIGSSGAIGYGAYHIGDMLIQLKKETRELEAIKKADSCKQSALESLQRSYSDNGSPSSSVID